MSNLEKKSDENCKKTNVSKLFGLNVFNDSVMRERLPQNTYKKLKKTIQEGVELDPSVAEIVANAMKDWAIEKGATHYTHWFQPLTSMTAEKHDSFIYPTSDGKVIMEFSGKELIKGEPDASSFPSGGLRATFEARGYTAWDCTSPAFIKEDGGGVTLCIPTAFCSYTGEALDEKTPLLRSMQALSKQAVRILKLFGKDVNKVSATVGAEQEYFLIDRELYNKRIDLKYTGRTLFGAKPPKGQELEDHYFGIIKERVASFMNDLNIELWKLGVSAKTQHNEVAPAQHELAAIFNTANIATDHNQLTMEIMKRVANRHGLACLLHEKPFAGVNGSGKHDNWSISTDDGQNLLDPGKTPHENEQFLIFLCSVIAAVDDYPELLRMSAANTGNDHRLGGNEAPPAIVSIFLGEQLTDILQQIEDGEIKGSKQGGTIKIGVTTLPVLPKDNTDRNRTSPFAFTGNKFEFRMVPSSGSVAWPNCVLNTIVAEELRRVADRLEKAEDFHKEVEKVLIDLVKKHKRIIFNGNGYSGEWIREASKRGLPNIKSTAEAIPYLIDPKSIELFEKHKVLSSAELHSRYEVLLDGYSKHINIEALTMIEMAKRQILPACIRYSAVVANSINAVKSAGANTEVAEDLLKDLTMSIKKFDQGIKELEASDEEAVSMDKDSYTRACYFRDKVFNDMENLREIGDHLETIADSKIWPMPTYGELLYSV